MSKLVHYYPSCYRISRPPPPITTSSFTYWRELSVVCSEVKTAQSCDQHQQPLFSRGGKILEAIWFSHPFLFTSNEIFMNYLLLFPRRSSQPNIAVAHLMTTHYSSVRERISTSHSASLSDYWLPNFLLATNLSRLYRLHNIPGH